jgi:very-long-chain (3R)-3-hydroxyacyl-CoA dehydratase
MVFAWSFTEVIRYTFYALNLVGLNPRFLLWLRYTTFYVLYPLGASSEAFITFATLPNSRPSEGNWTLWDFGRAFLFTIWWPGESIILIMD